MPFARWLAPLLLLLSIQAAQATSVRLPRRSVLDAPALAALIHDLRAQRFREERLAVLEQYARTRWFAAAQIAVVVPELEWREDRLRALALMAPWLTDRALAPSLLSLFPDDRRRAAEILQLAP